MDLKLFVLVLIGISCTTAILETKKSSIPVKPEEILAHPCMQKSKVSNLKNFLPLIKWPAHYDNEYRCQMPQGMGLEPEEETETQYLTLYNKEDRIPLFSAYQAQPFETNNGDTKPQIGNSGHVMMKPKNVKKGKNDKTEPVTKDNGGRQDWEEAKTEVGPKQSDYEIADGYDRGHLFPLQFASDPRQGKSTFKLTNAVPQDFLFNRNQWVGAETMLKKTFVFDCQDRGYTPIIFSGAVPDYLGLEEEEVRNMNPSPNLKIGQKQPVKYTKTWDTPLFKEMKSEARITVPTHMWSAFMCKGIDNNIVNHISYIGMNAQIGVVKWYNDALIFQNTLKKMYRINDDGPFFPATLSFPEEDSVEQKRITDLLETAVDKSEAMAVKYQTILPTSRIYLDLGGNLDLNKEKDEHWWDQAFMEMFQVRKRIEEQKFQSLAKRLGVDLVMLQLGADFAKLSIDDSNDMLTDSQPIKKRPRVDSEEKRRKKRDISSSIQTTFSLIEMIDASPTSDIALSQCTFKETYNGVEEKHTINYEENAFVEDQNTAGDEMKVSMIRNGEKTEIPTKPATSRYINIVLKPRSL